ncbi:MAG: Ig-like domain-containing protein [Eubacterium sp.]|nr:Ig-like domain-containing protein [Eubacterium sp.]
MVFLILAAVIVVIVIIICVIHAKKNNSENFTEDYDKVYALGSYSMKINSMSYLTDTKQLNFIYYCKKSGYGEAKSSKPIVSEVRFQYDEKGEKAEQFPFESETLNDIQSLYMVKDVEITNVRVIFVVLEYKDNDYYDADKVDEFGDVIKGEFHEGETHYFYIALDISDLKQIKSSEYAVPVLNSDELDNAETVTTAKDTEVISNNSNVQTSANRSTTKKAVGSSTDPSSERETEIPAGTTRHNASTRAGEAQAPADNTRYQGPTNTGEAQAPADTTRYQGPTNTGEAQAPADTTRYQGPTNTGEAQAPADTTRYHGPTNTGEAQAPSNTTRYHGPTNTGEAQAPAATYKSTTKSATSTTTQQTTASTKDTTKSSAKEINAIKLALDQHNIVLSIGDTASIKPVFEPTNSTDTFSWKSNREDRVIVDKSGKVTAVGTGSAIITCTDNETGLTASCMVTAN